MANALGDGSGFLLVHARHTIAQSKIVFSHKKVAILGSIHFGEASPGSVYK